MSEWIEEKLGDIASFRKGINYSSSDYGDESSGSPFITIKCFVKGGGYDKTGLKYICGEFLPADWLSEGELVFSVTDLTRAGDIVGSPLKIPSFGNDIRAVASMDCMRISPNVENCDSDFLYQRMMLSDIRRQMVAFSAGSTVLHLDTKQVPHITIKLPISLAEQRKIAQVLRTVDQAIEKTEQLIAKYQKIKAGVMNDLFTRGIGTDGLLRPTRQQAPELYQETPVGWIPKTWQCELLDDLAERGSGHTPSKSHPEYWNGGVKWISLADSSRLDNLFISDTQLNISNLGLQNSSAVLHPKGTVVLSRDAGVGKSAITTSPMAVSQHFMCWKCDEIRLHNVFLYYWLQNNKHYFENIAMGSTILTIGLSYFRKLLIGCPKSFDEQVAIAARLIALENKISALKAELVKKRQQKSGLMNDLLTGKVQVNVECHLPDEVTS